MIDTEWFAPPPSLDCGTWQQDDYKELAGRAAKMLHVATSDIFSVQPGNGTRYDLALAIVLNGPGFTNGLAVVWIHTGRGAVFNLDVIGELHEDYVAEKFRGLSLSDAWVLSRFLTALRAALFNQEVTDA